MSEFLHGQKNVCMKTVLHIFVYLSSAAMNNGRVEVNS